MPETGRYGEEISRKTPSLFVFLVDRSGSMEAEFGGSVEEVSNPSKAQGAADALNRCLRILSRRCARGEEMRNYFDVGIWGYGGSVGPILEGPLKERPFVPIAELYHSPIRTEQRDVRVPDGAGGFIVTKTPFPVWVEAVADGGTPMCQALREVRTVLEGWVASHPECYPPTVINITDGEATDGDPQGVATEIMRLVNKNGSNALLFNVHVSASRAKSVSYPTSAEALTDPYARQLFEMSSVLPETLVRMAQSEPDLGIRTGSRGFVFNASLVDLVRFLDIGTRKSTEVELRPDR